MTERCISLLRGDGLEDDVDDLVDFFFPYIMSPVYNVLLPEEHSSPCVCFTYAYLLVTLKTCMDLLNSCSDLFFFS